jgi:hypothetical protein
MIVGTTTIGSTGTKTDGTAGTMTDGTAGITTDGTAGTMSDGIAGLTGTAAACCWSGTLGGGEGALSASLLGDLGGS